MIRDYNIPTSLKQLITANQAFHHRIVPIEKRNDIIVFKTDISNIKDLQEELGVLFGYPVSLEKETSENLSLISA